LTQKLDSTCIEQLECVWHDRGFSTSVCYQFDGATPHILLTQEGNNTGDDEAVVVMSKVDFLRLADKIRGH